MRRSLTLPRRTVINLHRARIRSLRSVDDQVATLVDTLRAEGQLSNTYIFFTSDNGHLLGEHRLRWKNFPYEEAIRVPLLARGPGIPANVERPALYSLVDLAPTFLEIAGASRNLDGRSMLGTLTRGEVGYDAYLIQAATNTLPWWFRGVRSKAFAYVRYFGSLDNGFEELYDLRKDPYQLRNVARVASYRGALLEHRARLAALSDCAGATCWNGEVDAALAQSSDAPSTPPSSSGTPASPDGSPSTPGTPGGTTGDGPTESPSGTSGAPDATP